MKTGYRRDRNKLLYKNTNFFQLLKVLYVRFRKCLLTMTPVAVKSPVVSILLLAHVLTLCRREPASAKTERSIDQSYAMLILQLLHQHSK